MSAPSSSSASPRGDVSNQHGSTRPTVRFADDLVETFYYLKEHSSSDGSDANKQVTQSPEYTQTQSSTESDVLAAGNVDQGHDEINEHEEVDGNGKAGVNNEQARVGRNPSEEQDGVNVHGKMRDERSLIGKDTATVHPPARPNSTLRSLPDTPGESLLCATLENVSHRRSECVPGKPRKTAKKGSVSKTLHCSEMKKPGGDTAAGDRRSKSSARAEVQVSSSMRQDRKTRACANKRLCKDQVKQVNSCPKVQHDSISNGANESANQGTKVTTSNSPDVKRISSSRKLSISQKEAPRECRSSGSNGKSKRKSEKDKGLRRSSSGEVRFVTAEDHKTTPPAREYHSKRKPRAHTEKPSSNPCPSEREECVHWYDYCCCCCDY